MNKNFFLTQIIFRAYLKTLYILVFRYALNINQLGLYREGELLLKKNFCISAIVGFVTGLANGLFGSGGGTVVVPCMERFLGVSAHKAHATAIAVILPLSVLSMIIYSRNYAVDWSDIISVSLGGMIGGFVGARLLKKVPGKWLHRIFGIFMIAAAVRMIL